MKKRNLCLWLLVMLWLPMAVQAVIPDIKFRRLDTRDGLSNSQVNCILRDSRGFVWLPTQFGLCRYDGYRFRTFYSYETDTMTLRSNRVDRVMEAHDGRLWMYHGMSYSIYDPVTEKVDRWPTGWLAKQGITGGTEHVYIDDDKNYWVKTYDNGFFFFNPTAKTLKHIPFGYTATDFPADFGISAYCPSKQGMVLVSNQGELMCINAEKGKVLWRNDHVKRSLNAYNDYWVYVDKDNVTWVITHSTGTYIHVPQDNRWYTSLTELMRAKGFQDVPDDIVVWEVRYDKRGLLWVATDHMGVLLLDFKTKEWRQFTNQKGDETSLPDITAKHLYEDQLGRMWVATYKNGVAMSADAMSNFASLALGDINAITEDKQGHFWLGLNSGGILKVDPKTFEVEERFTKHTISVLNDVIVSAYTAKDGALWFGTWEGGLIKYKDGQWRNYTASQEGSALTTNNIWGVAEDYWGNIWVGVLGGGVARIDKRTGKQRSWNTKNSTIRTDWTNSISRASNGWILLGNSEYCSLVNPKTMRIINMPLPHDANTYTISAATTQALMDERGLIWQGSPSGLNVFDRKTGQSTLLDMKKGFYGSSVVAIAEDERHTMWVVTDHGISNVTPQQENGVWTFAVRSFNDRDGLQPGPFNQRAIYYSRSGLLLIGGQDGLDIINTRRLAADDKEEKPVFSGLQIFDEDVVVGEETDGRTLLEEGLDICRHITLRFNDQFTIQLASNSSEVHNPSRFVYKLEGFNDNWVKTSELNPNITYNSLRAGDYTLYVRMLKDDGTIGSEEAQLDITIRPPLWRSRWMMLLYMLLIAAAAWWWRKWFLRRQQQKMQVENLRRETEKQQWMNEMRSQLAKGAQPSGGLEQGGSDVKEESPALSLNCTDANLVTAVKALCKSFSDSPTGQKARLSFRSMEEVIDVSFDEELLAQALNILLTNSVKFAPGSPRITVNLGKTADGKAMIQVADNGIGIRDEYKVTAFDPMVGSEGIGLDKVKDVVVAHGGSIRLEDNPGGGTIFIITLPLSDIEVIEEAEIID